MNEMKSSGWDKPTILSRIADAKSMIRYEAGSPNMAETELYRSCILSGLLTGSEVCGTVLVLGMTPEIRSMALSCGFDVISMDRSSDAIDMYREWVPTRLASNEKIVNASWFEAGLHIDAPVRAVMGDGVFGNILSAEKHIELLRILKGLLTAGGVMVFRKILVPEGFDVEAYEARRLIGKYRSGLLTDDEFGFSMRLWGNYKRSYDPETFILDNSITFKLYQDWQKNGILTAKEYACISHYYFSGLNMIIPQRKWEELIASAGMKSDCHHLEGNDWYSYYPVYSLRIKT